MSRQNPCSLYVVYLCIQSGTSWLSDPPAHPWLTKTAQVWKPSRVTVCGASRSLTASSHVEHQGGKAPWIRCSSGFLRTGYLLEPSATFWQMLLTATGGSRSVQAFQLDHKSPPIYRICCIADHGALLGAAVINVLRFTLGTRARVEEWARLCHDIIR